MKKFSGRKAVRLVLLAVLVASLTMLTGCWNYRETEGLNIVCGLAVDRGEQKRYRMTFETLDLTDGGPEKSMKGRVIEAEGDTISDTVRNASRTMDKELYFSDCKIAVFSREIAENGIDSVLDWFNRDPGPRFTVQVLCSEEKTAGEILKTEKKTGKVVSFQISESLQSLAAAGKIFQTPLYQVDDILRGEGKDLAMPCIHTEKKGEEESTQISGSAVFRKDRYMGKLDADDTENCVFLTERLQNGVLLVGAKPEDRNISLLVRSSSADIKPQLKGGEPSVQIRLKTKCMFDEESGKGDQLKHLGIDGIERFASNTLQVRSEETVRKVQEQLGCDIFGFGRKIYETDPKQWEKLKADWPAHFRSLSVAVSADVNIESNGFAYPKEAD